MLLPPRNFYFRTSFGDTPPRFKLIQLLEWNALVRRRRKCLGDNMCRKSITQMCCWQRYTMGGHNRRNYGRYWASPPMAVYSLLSNTKFILSAHLRRAIIKFSIIGNREEIKLKLKAFDFSFQPSNFSTRRILGSKKENLES